MEEVVEVVGGVEPEEVPPEVDPRSSFNLIDCPEYTLLGALKTQW